MSYQERSQRFASWMGLPFTDGAALGEILWAENAGRPLTATRLQRRIRMTSGATNALLRRLEDRELITPTRDSTDRRVVTLRASEATQQREAAFNSEGERALAAIVAGYSASELGTVADFVDRMASVLDLRPAQEMDVSRDELISSNAAARTAISPDPERIS